MRVLTTSAMLLLLCATAFADEQEAQDALADADIYRIDTHLAHDGVIQTFNELQLSINATANRLGNTTELTQAEIDEVDALLDEATDQHDHMDDFIYDAGEERGANGADQDYGFAETSFNLGDYASCMDYCSYCIEHLDTALEYIGYAHGDGDYVSELLIQADGLITQYEND